MFSGVRYRGSALKLAVKQFFRTTTLHGFKYLQSPFCVDRVGWVLVCVASTCCAGVLCAVLWGRFLEEPALLRLQDMPVYSQPVDKLPLLAFCLPVENFLRPLNISKQRTQRLSRTITSILSGRATSERKLEGLEKWLSEQNTTLTDMLLKDSPPCGDLVVLCRWQFIQVPCTDIFEKELSPAGACCILRPDKAIKSLSESSRPNMRNWRTKIIDFVLQCSNETVHGCTFYAKYEFDDDANIKLLDLTPGYIYTSQMSFNSVPMSFTDEVVVSNCISDADYSLEVCKGKCAEKYCGCSSPFLNILQTVDSGNLQPCSVKQLSCLQTYDPKDNSSCVCVPSCNKITSDMSTGSVPILLDIFAIDPIYKGLNTKSTVLHFQLNLPYSKNFLLYPTETWLTLLSSLGGVFNMFLGVGLFSALEIMCLLLFKIPAIFFNSRIN